MLLNSYSFILFFIILFFAYFLVGKTSRLQNILLLIASYIFYFTWSFEFIALIVFSTAITYFVGNKIKNAEGNAKRTWMRIGVFFVLIQLLYFKYFNFFIENFNDLLNVFGMQEQLSILKLILPI